MNPEYNPEPDDRPPENPDAGDYPPTFTDWEPDIAVRDEGSIALLIPVSDSGAEWLEESIGHATRWANGYVVECRYVGAILDGANEAGLTTGPV